MSEFNLDEILSKLPNPERDYVLALIERDPLTGAHNRKSFNDYMAIQNSRMERGEGPLCLIMLDVDHFGKYNENQGHQGGDLALQKLVSVVRSTLRPHDESLIFRYGGEEFVLGFGGETAQEGRNIAERLRSAVEKECDFTVSVGVSDSLIAGENMENILATADRALYCAKHSGRNQVMTYENLSKMPLMKIGVRF